MASAVLGHCRRLDCNPFYNLAVPAGSAAIGHRGAASEGAVPESLVRSPAETAGLLLGDAILIFADFTPTKQMAIEEILE